jgi:protein phosphatase
MRVAQGSAASSTGRKRRHNEDAYVYDPPIFAVADGMGGARAGELASSLAANALRETGLDPAESAESNVVGLIQAANARVHERALSDSAASGMGTTMTVALFQREGNVVIGHVGDSRAYLLRAGKLVQLTEDHSLVAELVRRGELSPEQAEVHPQRSVITRALGTEPRVAIDAFTVATKDGDVFLLCSDGLTTMVDPTTITELVQRHRFELTAASRALLQAANDRGGEDNITAVLFAVADDDTSVHEAASTPATHFDEEDTLHPEDHVPPPREQALPGVDTTLIWRAAPALPSAGAASARAPHTTPAGPLRFGLALLAIVVLAALVVVLLVKGFSQ